MITTYLNSPVRHAKFTVGFADINALGAVANGDVPLFTIPQGGKILGAMLKVSTQFAGQGGTLTGALAKAGSAVFFSATTDMTVAPSDTALLEAAQTTSGFASGQLSALAVVLHVISGTGNVNVLTAGAIDVYVAWLDVFTPNA